MDGALGYQQSISDMAVAVCFKCGFIKNGALLACWKCGVAPKNNGEYAASLAISADFSSASQLVQYSNALRKGQPLTIPREILLQALNALKDPRFLEKIEKQKKISFVAARQPLSTPSVAPQHAPVKPLPSLPKTALQLAAFAILGVTVHDDRRRIVTIAEDKSLELDHEVCHKARSDLTTPRTRLSAEMAWLPGISPRQTNQLLGYLHHAPMRLRHVAQLPTLAHLNLLAAAFETVDGVHNASDFIQFITQFVNLAENLSPEQILNEINADRSMSGFPQLASFEQIEIELEERKRYYRNVIKDALDKLPSTTLVHVLTEAASLVTHGGKNHAPQLLDDIVDSCYVLATQEVLQKEAENLKKIIKAIKKNVADGEMAVQPYLDTLDTVARNWNKIALPIQLSMEARGIHHKASHDIAYEIRTLALHLFNEHDMLTQAQRLTHLMQELFSAVPDIMECIKEDAQTLENFVEERQQAAVQQKEEWAREISYRAEVGILFKDILSISPQGILWKGQNFPLDSITRVRWGGVRDGSGTTYKIAFGNRTSEAVVELRKQDVYNTFVSKLWRAVGIRLLTQLLEALKEGHSQDFGDARLHDDGITFVKHKWFSSDEKVRFAWSRIRVWSADGSLYIGAVDETSLIASMSYLHDAHTHIIEKAIQLAFKKSGMQRLSDVLE